MSGEFMFSSFQVIFFRKEIEERMGQPSHDNNIEIDGAHTKGPYPAILYKKKSPFNILYIIYIVPLV
ncbi:hypothetical protein AAZX31_02G183300 [Glycine max]